MFTSHGHQIMGTTAEPRPAGMRVDRCGGPRWCNVCRQDMARVQSQMTPGSVNMEDRPEMLSEGGFIERAKVLVWNQFYTAGEAWQVGDSDFHVIPLEDVYVVWFTKTLQNWKAIVSTNYKDDMIYEVTYNGDKKETYLDAYQKATNIAIPD